MADKYARYDYGRKGKDSLGGGSTLPKKSFEKKLSCERNGMPAYSKDNAKEYKEDLKREDAYVKKNFYNK